MPEFMRALRRHGDVRLRPLDIENVRTEVYRAARSVLPVQRMDATGRYQPMKIAIEPVTLAMSTIPTIGRAVVEPQPVVF